MRCKNCGWENDQNSLRCEKCNAPLVGSMVDNSVNDGRMVMAQSEEVNLKKTVRENNDTGRGDKNYDFIENNSNESYQKQESAACQYCGYPISVGMNVCPNCGESVTRAKVAGVKKEGSGVTCLRCGKSIAKDMKFCPYCGCSLRMGTVNVWEKPQQELFCTLRPITWKNEEVTYDPISFSGEIIILNRANTDPNNNSITSKEQAALIYENDSWYIEDRSEMHTTLLQINGKVKLNTGDIIVLGNRFFEFKC